MMVVTGATGFIGSCLISKLNEHNFNYIIAVDDFTTPDTTKSLEGKIIQEKLHRDNLFSWLDKNHKHLEFIYHLEDNSELTESKLTYSKKIWEACCQYQVPLIYISGKFDDWVLTQKEKPFFWVSLQINTNLSNDINSDKFTLSLSNHPDSQGKEPMGEIIYVKDLSEAIYYLIHHRKKSGIYRLVSN